MLRDDLGQRHGLIGPGPVALPFRRQCQIQALGEGWDVTVVTDASGAVSVEAHQVAIQRMIIATQTSVHSPAMTSWVRPVALTASTTVRSSQVLMKVGT
jgi:hypothetical protein